VSKRTAKSRARQVKKISTRRGKSSVSKVVRSSAPRKRPRATATSKPAKLLTGGNPQIAKAVGEAPVLAYIAAMPGWKSEVGRRLDALVTRTVPYVQRAVKWNAPFYGVAGHGWFLSFYTFTHYVKVTFFRGRSLRPIPPGESKPKEVRYLVIRENDVLDEAQMKEWIEQAIALPGWEP